GCRARRPALGSGRRVRQGLRESADVGARGERSRHRRELVREPLAQADAGLRPHVVRGRSARVTGRQQGHRSRHRALPGDAITVLVLAVHHTRKRPIMTSTRSWIRLASLGLGLLLAAGAARAEKTLLNVSYDPTRELYEEYNALFAKHWK